MELTLRQAVAEFKDAGLDCPTHEVIRKWAHQGRIKAHRTQSVWKNRTIWQIDRQSLEDYLKRRKNDRETENQAKQDSTRQNPPRRHRNAHPRPAESGLPSTARNRVQRNHRDGQNRHRDNT